MEFSINSDGHFFGLPEGVYRAAPGVAQSDLKEMAKSPAHYRARVDGAKPEATAAMEFGTLVHIAVLEPERLAGSFVVRPDGMKFTTKEGKAWKEAQTLPIIDKEQEAGLMAIRDSIAAHKSARAILAGAKTEVSVFAKHAATGILRKGRIDALTLDRDGLTTIGDVKTTDDASLEGFSRSIAKWGYHRQAAYYMDLVGASFFCFIAVEKAAPYAVNVFSLDAESIALGRATYERELTLLAECEAAGQWPAYGGSINEISVPRWLKAKEGV